MKKLLWLVSVAVVMITLCLAGCKEASKTEHPSTSTEYPSEEQPKSEHPTEHPE